VSVRRRLTPRVVPASPITVAIEDEAGATVGYGALADVSGNGACVWTDAALTVGASYLFRISFARPPDVHDVVGVVVWCEPDAAEGGARRAGLEWLGATRSCRERLRHLAARAVQPSGHEDFPFQARWKVPRPAPTDD